MEFHILVVDEGISLASGNWSTASRNQYLMLMSLVKLEEEVRSCLQYNVIRLKHFLAIEII